MNLNDVEKTHISNTLSKAIINALDLKMVNSEVLQTFENCIANQQFTAMTYHQNGMNLERIYSNTPESYPVGGRKSKLGMPWGQQVLVEGRVYVGSGINAIEWAFDDATKILDLGLLCVLNVPIINGNQTRGTINFLRSGPAFTAFEVSCGQLLAAALAFRMNAQEDK
ncbi:MAG: GAF domain-containing protein [Sulfitobacter sp.]